MSVDISEAQYAQGDVVRAVRMIVTHGIPLTQAGAVECERQMREFGEGNRALWVHPNYLQSVAFMAQDIIRTVLEGALTPWIGST